VGKILVFGNDSNKSRSNSTKRNDEQIKLMKCFLPFIFHMESRRLNEMSMHNTYKKKSHEVSTRWFQLVLKWLKRKKLQQGKLEFSEITPGTGSKPLW